MAKFRKFQNSLIAGEISPSAMGRTDIPQYQHACKLLRNMIITPSGMAYRRPGTLHMTKTTGDVYAPRIIPFHTNENSDGLGGNYFISIKHTSGSTTTAVAYRIGDVGSFDATGELSGLASSASVSNTLPYAVSNGSRALGVGFNDEWQELHYAQSGDILYMVHPNRKPQRIYRTASGTFVAAAFDTDYTGTTLTSTSFRDAWPYLPRNDLTTPRTYSPGTVAITLTPGATTGSGISLTASAAFFNSKHVGAVFKILQGTTYGCCLVTGYTSTTVVTVTVIVDFADTSSVATWWESAWSDYRGWPRTLTIGDKANHRILYGGTKFQPDYYWASKDGNYNVLSIAATTDPYATSADTDPFTGTLPSSTYSTIQWMDFDKTLQIGTDQAEWVLSLDVETAAFVPANIIPERQGEFGSSYHQPIRIGNSLVHIDSSQRSLGVLTFDDTQKAFIREDLNTLYDEFPYKSRRLQTEGIIRGMTWDRTRKIIWCIDGEGNLRGATYDKQARVLAWHSHELGGYSSAHTGTGFTDGGDAPLDTFNGVDSGRVVSITVMPNFSFGGNDLILCTRRYIGSAWVFHYERMLGTNQLLNATSDFVHYYQSHYYYTDDCSGGFDYSTGSLSAGVIDVNLSHLNGESIVGTNVNARGMFKLTCSDVSSGSTTVSSYASSGIDAVSGVMSVGYSFSSIIIPVRPDVGSQIGSAQGALKRIHEVNIRFYKTLSAKVGSDSSTLETIIFRDGSTLMGYSPDFFTGDKRIKLQSNYDYDGYIYILQDQPLPFAVVGISMEGQVYD